MKFLTSSKCPINSCITHTTLFLIQNLSIGWVNPSILTRQIYILTANLQSLFTPLRHTPPLTWFSFCPFSYLLSLSSLLNSRLCCCACSPFPHLFFSLWDLSCPWPLHRTCSAEILKDVMVTEASPLFSLVLLLRVGFALVDQSVSKTHSSLWCLWDAHGTHSAQVLFPSQSLSRGPLTAGVLQGSMSSLNYPSPPVTSPTHWMAPKCAFLPCPVSCVLDLQKNCPWATSTS